MTFERIKGSFPFILFEEYPLPWSKAIFLCFDTFNKEYSKYSEVKENGKVIDSLRQCHAYHMENRLS